MFPIIIILFDYHPGVYGTLRNPPFKIGQRNGTKDSVNDLWSITLELAKSTKLNCWVKTAALVFTSFWRDIGLLDDVTWHHLAQLYDTLRKKTYEKAVV